MKRPQSLTAKLKNVDSEITNYVIELEKENLKLQKEKAKLQVKVVSQQNEIAAIKQALPKLTVQIQKYGTGENLAEQMKKARERRLKLNE